MFFKVPIKFQSHLQIVFIANHFKCPNIYFHVHFIIMYTEEKIKIQETRSKHPLLIIRKSSKERVTEGRIQLPAYGNS